MLETPDRSTHEDMRQDVSTCYLLQYTSCEVTQGGCVLD